MEATRDLAAEQTLFIVSSKTFGTLESLTNATSARDWVVRELGDEAAVSRHLARRFLRTPSASVSSVSTRRALIVMTIAHGIQHFYVAGLAVAYPFVVTQFRISYAELGLWLSAAGLLGGLLQAAAGLLHWVSARAMLAAQDVAMVGTALLGAVAPGFGVFGPARAIPQSPLRLASPGRVTRDRTPMYLSEL